MVLVGLACRSWKCLWAYNVNTCSCGYSDCVLTISVSVLWHWCAVVQSDTLTPLWSQWHTGQLIRIVRPWCWNEGCQWTGHVCLWSRMKAQQLTLCILDSPCKGPEFGDWETDFQCHVLLSNESYVHSLCLSWFRPSFVSTQCCSIALHRQTESHA